jgi:signal peptidase I
LFFEKIKDIEIIEKEEKTVKRFKKAVPILITLLFVLVLVSILACVFKEYPFLLGADYSFRVRGYSMFPARRTNDLMFVKRGINEIEIDDIICFRALYSKGYCLVGHRVTEIQIYPCLLFKTKGDANKFSDGWISEKDIVGKEILNIPFGFLLAKNCFILLAGMIFILVLVIRK